MTDHYSQRQFFIPLSNKFLIDLNADVTLPIETLVLASTEPVKKMSLAQCEACVTGIIYTYTDLIIWTDVICGSTMTPRRKLPPHSFCLGGQQTVTSSDVVVY